MKNFSTNFVNINLNFLFILIFLANINIIFAQTFQFTIGGNEEDYMKCITKTDDGGFISAGNTNSTDLGCIDDDIYVIKCSGNGVVQWTKIFHTDTSGTSETINSIIQTSDYGFALLGTLYNSQNEEDILFIKLDSIGNVQNKIRIGNQYKDIGNSITEIFIADSSFGYAIAGSTEVFLVDKLETRALFIKLYPDLSIERSKIVPDTLVRNFYSEYKSIKEIYELDSGNYQIGGYILVGSAQSEEFTQNKDLLITFFDEQYMHYWSKVYSKAGNYEIGNDIIESEIFNNNSLDNTFIAAGTTTPIFSNPRLFLIKISWGGTVIWSRDISGRGSFDQHYVKLIKTFDDNFAISTSTNAYGSGLFDMYALKMDFSGNMLWNTTIGGTSDDFASGITELNNNIILSGFSNSFSLKTDAYFVALDLYGNSCDNQSQGGIIDSTCSSFFVGASDDIYLNVNQVHLNIDSGGVQNWVCQSENKFKNNLQFFKTTFSNNQFENSDLIKFNINFNIDIKNVSIEIFDILGNKIKNSFYDLFYNENEINIKISNLPTGFFFVRIYEGESVILTKKLMKIN